VIAIAVVMVKKLGAAEGVVSLALGWEWRHLGVVFAGMIAGNWAGTAEPPDTDCSKAFWAVARRRVPSLR